MADVFTKDKRSEIMSHIRSSGNKTTEIALIQFFKEYGISGWKRHYNVKGHPDFVFLSHRVAVFVDGCFWHGHNCRNTKPEQNALYWERKRQRNHEHDLKVNKLFESRGWKVIRIWECELKKKNKEQLINRLQPILLEAGIYNKKTIQ